MSDKEPTSIPLIRHTIAFGHTSVFFFDFEPKTQTDSMVLFKPYNEGVFAQAYF